MLTPRIAPHPERSQTVTPITHFYVTFHDYDKVLDARDTGSHTASFSHKNTLCNRSNVGENRTKGQNR